MVDLHLSDDEQAERLKAWWKENGSSVIVGAIAGIGIIVGVNLWRDFKSSQAETASALYESMLATYRQQNVEASTKTGAEILNKFQNTPYAGMAALLLAKINFDKKDIDSARGQLRWAMDNSKDPATVHTARLRLARILLSENRIDQVKELLNVTDFGGFQSEYKELEGDVYMSLGERAQAHEAYQSALETLPEGSTYREILRLKLDSAMADTDR